MQKHKGEIHHITSEDRKEIQYFLDKGYSLRAVSYLLKKSVSSICGEVERGSTAGVYDPVASQHRAYVKRKYSKYQGMKIVEHPNLRNFVETYLKEDWSPEEISGRLKYEEKSLPYVSAKGIYTFIKSCYGGSLSIFLRYNGKKKKKRENTKGSGLEGRTFIEKRPKHVGKRRHFGHWEADFIVSGKSGSGALLVFVERKTRYVLIFKLADRKVVSINYVLETLTGASLVARSLTIDNDVCFRHHKEMSRILGCPIFFCHPYHSWEKGTVENMNKWIRQYVKKGSDIASHTHEYIQFVQDRLNARPRKCLRFKTPQEAFEHHLRFKKEISDIIKVIQKQKIRQGAVFGLRG